MSDQTPELRKGGTEAGSIAPPRRYSWPPVEAGNTVSLKHGARSPRIYEPLARDLLEQVRPAVTWWTTADEPTIWAWAIVESRAHLIRTWLEDRGSEVDEETGDVLGASRQLDRLDARCESLRSKLGLDPLSRARLGRDVAAGKVDLARLMAEADDGDEGDR